VVHALRQATNEAAVTSAIEFPDWVMLQYMLNFTAPTWYGLAIAWASVQVCAEGIADGLGDVTTDEEATIDEEGIIDEERTTDEEGTVEDERVTLDDAIWLDEDTTSLDDGIASLDDTESAVELERAAGDEVGFALDNDDGFWIEEDEETPLHVPNSG
jgi:hypothetical protein